MRDGSSIDPERYSAACALVFTSLTISWLFAVVDVETRAVATHVDLDSRPDAGRRSTYDSYFSGFPCGGETRTGPV